MVFVVANKIGMFRIENGCEYIQEVLYKDAIMGYILQHEEFNTAIGKSERVTLLRSSEAVEWQKKHFSDFYDEDKCNKERK